MEFLRNVPIGQYVSGGSGWLRSLDPRLKFAWVLMFLISPVLSGLFWRLGLVVTLLCITAFGSLPWRVIKRPLLILIMLSFLFGLLAIFLPTNEPVSTLTVRSSQEIPKAMTFSNSWEIIRIGPIDLGPIPLGLFVVDQRSAELGMKTATLIFTVVHSVNLMLITTSPEDLMWTLRWYLTPLTFIGFPLERLSFQLLLALRFIPLVQEEFQNLIRSILTRGVSLKKLGFKKSVGVLLVIGERLLTNILLRAEQGADALIIRNGGFMLSPDLFKPKILFGHRETFGLNIFSIIVLIGILILRQSSFGSL